MPLKSSTMLLLEESHSVIISYTFDFVQTCLVKTCERQYFFAEEISSVTVMIKYYATSQQWQFLTKGKISVVSYKPSDGLTFRKPNSRPTLSKAVGIIAVEHLKSTQSLVRQVVSIKTHLIWKSRYEKKKCKVFHNFYPDYYILKLLYYISKLSYSAKNVVKIHLTCVFL